MIEQLAGQRLRDMHIVTGFEIKQKTKYYEDQGHDIIHLELGEPDFNTPENIVEAGVAALREGYTHYSPPVGLASFRESIAQYVRRYKKVDATADNILVTPGAKPIFFLTLLALVQPGDEVILPSPGFGVYEPMVKYCGGIPVPMPLREENDFVLNPEDLANRLTDRTKLVILNSPHNPTGGVMKRETVEAVADLLRDRNLAILSDEIYDRMIYTDDEPISIASLPGMAEKTIILDGFSKTYAMTGWRLGFGVMPEALRDIIRPLVVSSHSCTATFSQIAGIEALEGDQSHPTNMIKEYRKRRDFFIAGINDLPHMSCAMPQGAFYAFPNITGLGMDSNQAADFFLEEAKIACIPGGSFGHYGEGFVRFSYANSMENLAEALNRLEGAIGKRKS